MRQYVSLSVTTKKCLRSCKTTHWYWLNSIETGQAQNCRKREPLSQQKSKRDSKRILKSARGKCISSMRTTKNQAQRTCLCPRGKVSWTNGKAPNPRTGSLIAKPDRPHYPSSLKNWSQKTFLVQATWVHHGPRTKKTVIHGGFSPYLRTILKESKFKT